MKQSAYPDYAPYFTTDRDALDYQVYSYDEGYAVFSPKLESTVRHLVQAIKDRGDTIHIAFIKIPLFKQFDSTCVSLMQGGDPTYHAEVWFGENVVQLGATSSGVALYSLPRQDSVWEIVKLPFKDTELAFRLCVDIVRSCNRKGIHYQEHFWQNLECGVCRAVCGRDLADRWVCGDDYDEERPDTWTRGVHCSQVVLLFLKRCVRHGVLPASAGERLFFLRTYSHTCLPKQLRGLLDVMWGDRLTVETRDMDNVPHEVMERWYGEYYRQEPTRGVEGLEPSPEDRNLHRKGLPGLARKTKSSDKVAKV